MGVATSPEVEKRRFLDTEVLWQARPHHDGVSELGPDKESTSQNRSLEHDLTFGMTWRKGTILAGTAFMSSTYSSG